MAWLSGLFCLGMLCLGSVSTLVLVFPATAAEADSDLPQPVVMVCEHGTVKSLIAVQLFHQEASKRGLSLRAISRGLEPDETVPKKIAEALGEDGFDISGFDPQKLSQPGCHRLPSGRCYRCRIYPLSEESAASSILRWDDIPPASVDYEASKASLLAQVPSIAR